MGPLLIVLAVALIAGALVFGVTVLIMGNDQGLEPAEPDGRGVGLPVARPLTETDFSAIRLDTAARGYRMAQVDQALRRAAYDVGYKEELINVLEAEVDALRDGRLDEAESLRQAREAAAVAATASAEPAGADGSPAEPSATIDLTSDVTDPAEPADPADLAAPGAGDGLREPSGVAHPTGAIRPGAVDGSGDPADDDDHSAAASDADGPDADRPGGGERAGGREHPAGTQRPANGEATSFDRDLVGDAAAEPAK